MNEGGAYRKCVPERALSICGILKRVEDLLQSDLFAVLLVHRLPHDPIGLRRGEERLALTIVVGDMRGQRTPFPNLVEISYLLSTCLSISSLISSSFLWCLALC